MGIPFEKYHGTGNDFIIINHLKDTFIDPQNYSLIRKMCSRRFGIGADGLMIIEPGDNVVDFKMKYYNADGNPSSMCGNGGRCISTAFLEHVGSRNKTELKFSFNTDIYSSSLNREKNWISLQMQNVNSVEMDDVAFVLDTGSPHYVTFLEDVNDLDVREMGSEIRNNLKYQTHGINVNFCSWNDNLLHVRTYERGVEDETYSCGTGVVASALSLSLQESFRDDDFSIKIKTLGGELAVRFTKKDSSFYNIKLEGPTVKVYQGIYFVQ